MQMDPHGPITTEGATVEEAIKKALGVLHITRKQAKVEILSEGKQGFLGIGSKKARVKVGLLEEEVAERQLTDILGDLQILDEGQEQQYRPKVEDSKFGIVEVKDGTLVITNPQEEGKYATVKSGQHVNLTVNGKLTEEETQVSEQDEIQIELVNEETKSSFDLRISKDKSKAFLKLVRQPGTRYKLKEQPQSDRLIILTEVDEIIELSPVTTEEVKRYLEENKVVKGISDESLQQVIDNPNCKEGIIVAEGQAPIEPIDWSICYPFLEDEKDDEEKGFFERNRIVSIMPGEIVAVKVPGREGQDGWTVTGEQLPAKKMADCGFVVKSGCEITDNGEKVVATVGGRPTMDTVGDKTTISIEPIYEVNEVTQATGDIQFTGDVEVKTNINDGCKVTADGNIVVFGDVTRAVIKAGAEVIVHKSVLGSTITAGGRSAVYSSILPSLVQIKELLGKIWVVAGQLKDAHGFKTSDLKTDGDGTLIQLLIESKFQELPKLIKGISETVSGAGQSLHEELLNDTTMLHRSLCGLGPLSIDRIEHLQVLYQAVDQDIALVNGCMSNKHSIRLRYVQNSELMSSGDVIIEGQGGYITSITAGGDVIVTGSPGIARGVKIVSDGNVTIKELGSEFDTQTSVKIRGKGKLSAEFIHPNVVIQVGGEKYRVDTAYRNFEAYINNEGRLVIDKLLAETKSQ